LATVGLAGLALLVRRRNDWILTGIACAALLAGYLLHLFMGEQIPHAPGWVRLGNLTAYLLLAGVMLRRAAVDTRWRTPGVVTLSEARQAFAPWEALEACRHVIDVPSMEAALQHTASAINAALNAQVTAIGMVQSGKRMVDLVVVQQTGLPPKAGGAFHIDSQPAVECAITWRRSVTVLEGDDPNRLTLPGLLGCPGGWIYIHPLVHAHEVLGVLIVYFRKVFMWSHPVQQSLDFMAGELAMAIAKRRQVDYYASTLAGQDTTVRQLSGEVDQLKTRLDEERSTWDHERAGYVVRLERAETEVAQTLHGLRTLLENGQGTAAAQPDTAPPPSP
jgi:hypothetical protein